MRRAGVATPLIIIGLLAGCTDRAPPAPVAAPPGPGPAVAPAPVAAVDTSVLVEPVGPESPLGDAAPVVQEPRVPPDRTSPPALVRSFAAALEQGDVASLARLRAGVADKPRLDEDDLALCERDFLGPRAAHWRRVLAALDREALERLAATAEEQVSVGVPMGGALGENTLVLERRSGGWQLRP